MFLTTKPQVTYFRSVHRRHTPFSMESMEQSYTGNADFGRKITCLVSRNGDLIYRGYLEVTLPQLTSNGGGQTVAWTRNVGHVLLQEVTVDIGGTIIDKHYGTWLTIYNELTQTAEHEDGYNVMIGNTATLTTPAASIPSTTLHIPLIFWFNRNPTLALPLVALPYHDVKISFQFRPASECYVTSDSALLTNTPSLNNVTFYLDYIFLDTPERKMFSTQTHEYLIEQLQFNGIESVSNSNVRQKISFAHPTKALYWVLQPSANTDAMANRWTDFTDNGAGANPYAGGDTMSDCRIQVNTHDRVSTRDAAYYSLVQSYYHHTRSPATGIYMYSFALDPEKHQPSGTINLSRLEGIYLVMNLTTGTNPVNVHVFGVNYNVLRIKSGLGGLAFAS